MPRRHRVDTRRCEGVATMSELQEPATVGSRAAVRAPRRSGPLYREDAAGRAVVADATTTRSSSTGRLERSLRRAIAERPADGLADVGLLVGPAIPDRYAPSVTLAVNALVEVAARYARARRVDVVVGLRGDELIVQAQYDGVRPGADPALDPHAARLRRLVHAVEACGGTVDVERTGGRTVLRLRTAGAASRGD
jgi:hypothetical protein